MAETSKFHSSLAITNVKTLIPITLDLESGQYHSWVALFKVHVKVHNVLEHIIPPTDAKEKAVYDKAKVDDLPLLKRLNAAVLQWIYATVSSDILTSILIDDDLAEHAWHSVVDLFHDNKNSRALYLNKAFTNISFLIFWRPIVLQSSQKSCRSTSQCRGSRQWSKYGFENATRIDRTIFSFYHCDAKQENPT